jgi:ribonuclease HI
MLACICPAAHAWGIYVMAGDRRTCLGCGISKHTIANPLNQIFYLPEKSFRIIPFAQREDCDWEPSEKADNKLKVAFEAGKKKKTGLSHNQNVFWRVLAAEAESPGMSRADAIARARYGRPSNGQYLLAELKKSVIEEN